MSPIDFDQRVMGLPLGVDRLKQARAFLDQYELQEIIGSAKKLTILGNATQQRCRFCKLMTPVTFNNVAHIIPDFMGNRYVSSNFECDACNSLFSRYESSLANFLGLSRTVSQIPGKAGKIPSYEDYKLGF